MFVGRLYTPRNWIRGASPEKSSGRGAPGKRDIKDGDPPRCNREFAIHELHLLLGSKRPTSLSVK